MKGHLSPDFEVFIDTLQRKQMTQYSHWQNGMSSEYDLGTQQRQGGGTLGNVHRVTDPGLDGLQMALS
jgi:hypothetical protein